MHQVNIQRQLDPATISEAMQQFLVNNRFGRVLLHGVCALRDHHWTWHRQGVARELRSRLNAMTCPPSL
jgi:hypothetical protein